MEELISIIIPVYNVEAYLEECLESLENQSYKNFEAIVIDDGSKDKSGKICDKYAQNDKRIKVIHKKNEGVSKARNVGLDIANGKYITFLDADDYLHVDGLKNLLETIKENQSDIAISGVKDIKDGIEIRSNPKIKATLNREEMLKMFFEERAFQCVIWAKIYTKEIIGKERFDETLTIAEDFDFIYRIFKKMQKGMINTYKLSYYYRIRSGSLMRQKYNKKFENEIELSKKVLEDIKIHFPNLVPYSIRRYQRIILSCVDKYFREKNEIEGVEYLLKRLNEYPIRLAKKERLKLFLLKHQKWILRKIYIRLGKME